MFRRRGQWDGNAQVDPEEDPRRSFAHTWLRSGRARKHGPAAGRQGERSLGPVPAGERRDGSFSFEVVEEGPFAEGKRHGLWTSGNSQADGFGYIHQGPFVHGRKHGNWITRYPDGESHPDTSSTASHNDPHRFPAQKVHFRPAVPQRTGSCHPSPHAVAE